MSLPAGDIYYGRKSRGNRDDEQAIDSQFDAIRHTFSGEGRPVYGTFRDEPCEGDVWPREHLDEALEAARQPHVTRLLVDHPDRLWRGESWKLGWIENEFDRLGVEVRYASIPEDHSEHGELLRTVLAGVAKMERANITRRTQRGRASKLARDAVWSESLYGMQYVPRTSTQPDGHYEIVEDQAAYVRQMFERVLDGQNCVQVADWLNDQGQRTVRGNLWVPGAVRDVIRNTRYSGRPTKNKTERVTPTRTANEYNRNRKHSSRPRPAQDVQYATSSLVLVAPQVQDAAIARLREHQKTHTRNSKHAYLLGGGMVRCGQPLPYDPSRTCGNTMSPTLDQRGHVVYRCTRNRSNDRSMPGCCKGRIKGAVLEPRVVAWVEERLRTPEKLVSEILPAQGEIARMSASLEAQLASAHTRRDGIQTKLDALLDLHLDGKLDPATFERKQAELTTQRSAVETEIDGLTTELATVAAQQVDRLAFLDYIKQASGLPTGEVYIIRHVPDAGSRERIRQLVGTITVHPDGSLEIAGTVRGVITRDAAACMRRIHHATPQDDAYRFTLTIPAAAA